MRHDGPTRSQRSDVYDRPPLKPPLRHRAVGAGALPADAPSLIPRSPHGSTDLAQQPTSRLGERVASHWQNRSRVCEFCGQKTGPDLGRCQGTPPVFGVTDQPLQETRTPMVFVNGAPFFLVLPPWKFTTPARQQQTDMLPSVRDASCDRG